ncbi:MAG: prepilin-type N-terminal cleavage/methylation domain-containing protein [Deltaproteobacteria bacterium]|nr:prepilin-type N-terminal cleavage/methylation domain-containing protein [Deltaproteobacteria bacterium]MBN2673463.1 prepilin-type N-terminal cleavage/methylation domain-containing protein [Deltaproteobacteria bacterium]
MNRRGFTLMEIMIVIVIIGIVVTGAAFGFGATSKAKLKSAAWSIVSASKYAYSRAVSKGVTVRMVLDFEGRSIQLQETSGRVVLNRDDETGVGLNREDSEDEYMADGSIEEGDMKDKLRNIGPKFPTPQSTGSSGDGGIAPLPVTDPFLQNLIGGNGLEQVTTGVPMYKGPRFMTIDGNQGKKRTFGGDVGFLQVFSPHSPNVIDKGFAFVYYFPGGTTEHTYIQISDFDDEASEISTVVIHPLNGRAIIHHEELEPLEDLSELQEGER